MKLCIASDVHLEFGDCMIKNEHNADVLILAGDICVAKDAKSSNYMGERVREFFQRASFQFPHVIYIMGNHEHYHGDFSKSELYLQEMLAELNLSNVFLLEKQTLEINDYLFVGGTLWTDFNQADELTLRHAEWAMNDFRGVKHTLKGHAGGNWKFLPKDALDDHYRMRDYIKHVIDNRRDQGRLDKKVVVVGHHCPSPLSIHAKYQNDTTMNGCFASDLTEFIMDRPEIALWVHGHTHEDFDYMLGTTRVVCNPRGYIGHENRADTWTPKLVTL
jgi:Icc-related predicted phosphoesterase